MTNRRQQQGRTGAALAASWIVAGLALAGAGPLAAAPPEPETAESETAEVRFADRDQRYRIQPGDVLWFQFRFTPEYNQSVKVQPDGYVSLAGIDDLKVGGLSVDQVHEEAVRACRNHLREPVINVVLEEFSMPGYIVGGEVGSPGRYDLRGEITLSEAIQIAGGFGSKAHIEQVMLFRRAAEGWMESRQVDFKKLIKSGLNEDVRLLPGDMVFIPGARMGKLRRFMDVARVGLFFTPFGLL
jgi:polysaccharide export outer membrane protein